MTEIKNVQCGDDDKIFHRSFINQGFRNIYTVKIPNLLFVIKLSYAKVSKENN